MEEKRYKSGDFEYLLKDASYKGSDGELELCYEINTFYIGPTGSGSVAHIDPIDFKAMTGGVYCIWKNYEISALEGLDVEKVIANEFFNPVGMAALKDVEFNEDHPYEIHITNCPAIERVFIKELIAYPIDMTGNAGPVRVEYHKGIKDLDSEVAPEGIHAVFGDEVEDVGVIRGGHVTLGKGVKEIKALKKAEFGLKADTSVGEYELPTRIDFATAEPPLVGSVAPGAMTVAELHVPAGTLDAYMNHRQWGKAAYFVEEGGKTVDKYAAKHKARMKKLQKEHAEAAAQAAEKAKEEKIAAMGGMMHSTLATQRLAKWNPKLKYDRSKSLEYLVEVTPLVINLTVPKSAPIDIWDKIVAQLEEIETKLSK